MDILSHFRTIEELTKTLSREQRLLSEMFEEAKANEVSQSNSTGDSWRKREPTK